MAIDPYYQEDGITLYHGDCREILPGLPPVDMVLTDPPYGVNYEGGHMNERKRDAIIGDDGNVYSWAVPLAFNACVGPCYFFFAVTRSLDVFSAVSKARGQVHAMLVWHKTNAKYAAMNAQYKQRHEPILYCKGPNAKTMWCGPTTEATVWDMARDPENTFHPTQKPVEVMERAIGNHDAAIVLDPFSGSGSTLVAAKHLHRKAIGVEIEERYCEMTANRLAQGVLPFPDGDA
tara:strand:+ start:1085 stop:1783 length:699 start_codon:yes stop_codon:yes gene_type:complete